MARKETPMQYFQLKILLFIISIIFIIPSFTILKYYIHDIYVVIRFFFFFGSDLMSDFTVKTFYLSYLLQFSLTPKVRKAK